MSKPTNPDPKTIKKPTIKVKITRPPRVGGRPSKLTAELANKIVSLLQAGITMEIATQAVGITATTAYQWIDKGKRENPGHPYREFADAIGKARALCEINLVSIIAKNAPQDSDDAKWLLERMFPARYGKHVALQIAGETHSHTHNHVQVESNGAAPIQINLPAFFARPRILPQDETQQIKNA